MSSDSSEDDNERFRDAVDTTLFNDEMFKNNTVKKKELKINAKSNRYLSVDEQHCDVRVSCDMQKQIGKKISSIIENKITFIDVVAEDNVEQSNSIDGGIRLFSDSTDFLTHEIVDEPVNQKPRKKIKKRKIEDDNDKNDCIAQASISPEFILSKDETKHWKSRRKEKLYKYKSIPKNGKVLMRVDE